MAWLGWIALGILACWIGFFSLMHQQQLDVLRLKVNQAVREAAAQHTQELSDLENAQSQLEAELSREQAKTIDARNERDRIRDEVEALDNQVAAARRDLDAVSTVATSQDQDTDQGRAVLVRDAKRLESDIRKLRNSLSLMAGSAVGSGGVP